MMITLNVKLFRGMFDCYATIAGYDYVVLSNEKQTAIQRMLDKCEKMSPEEPVKINDTTAPDPDTGDAYANK